MGSVPAGQSPTWHLCSAGPSLVLSLVGSVLSSDLVLSGEVAVTAWARCRQVCSDRAVSSASPLARAPIPTRRCSSGSQQCGAVCLSQAFSHPVNLGLSSGRPKELVFTGASQISTSVRRHPGHHHVRTGGILCTQGSL